MREKFAILLFLILPAILYSQANHYARTLHWQKISRVPVNDNETISMLRFQGSVNEPENEFLPKYFERFALPDQVISVTAEIRYAIYDPLTADDAGLLTGLEKIGKEITVNATVSFEDKKPYALVSFTPLKKNEITGQYEKLVQFSILIKEKATSDGSSGYKSGTYSGNSVLTNGNWYKVAVTQTGIYKITYQELVDMGLPIGAINPKNIRIYGNGGGMLPESLDKFRYDDLQENAIFVSGEADGGFDPGDYILFYGQGPDLLKYSSSDRILKKEINLYSNYTYYFITADLGEGKRIQSLNSSTSPPTNVVTTFNDAIHYEQDLVNLISSGRHWFGEVFDLNTQLIKEFSIPNLKTGSKAILTASVAAQSDSPSSFDIYLNNVEMLHLPVQQTNSTSPNTDFAKTKTDTVNFNLSDKNLTFKIVYNKSLSSSLGWLDYFNLNVIKDLSFNGGQFGFRSFTTADAEVNTEYTVSKATQNMIVWNVTDPLNVVKMNGSLANTKFVFTQESDQLQEYVAFDGTSFYSVESVGQVANQNLHGLEDYDMVIITHPAFKDQAERLAEFHITHDGLSVLVTTPALIYNEFSSGAQDITAIRDFMKMMYDKASAGKEPKYLLLFGDASFDYKDRVANNTNFIPSWESPESLNPVSSIVKDDYYGMLDGPNDYLLDVGIGRFVVSTASQAKTAVDKVIKYAVNTKDVMGDWRNIACLIADDEDNNLHFGDAEELAGMIDTVNKEINVEKIYLDAYPQVSTPSGERYPDVTLDINNRINRGALLINYIGHGGEGGLAHERIMQIADINSWHNINNMPVFITATCEFSRFDDPNRTSAGEYVFLNPNGGGISLFTTTRATYAGPNIELNRNFYLSALKRVNGEYLRMGDIIKLAKNASGTNDNKDKFSLLGDPALKIAFPKQRAVAIKMTNIQKEEIDTIQALLRVTISGEMEDYQGNKLTDFNGTLYPTVFDKPATYTTLGNDPASIPAEFHVRKNALYKGKAKIQNGQWEFTFIAPKDIAYQYGFGKLSLYAKNDVTDATGYYDKVVIGGYYENAETDNSGPEIRMYINDPLFISGGLTDQNPKLFANIFDESGINTVGSGIGHDITVTVDDNKTYILNDYYESELDDFTRGNLLYPFYNLKNGKHNLMLRVWDIYNNSSTASIDLIIAESGELALNGLMNYPNPFKTETKFSFEHNQVDQPLNVKIQIFSLSGQLVKEIDDIYYAGGYKYESATWNGTAGDGSPLKGMYVYRLLVTNHDGSVAESTNKLVIIR